jgi:hypothetical protein
MFKLLRKAMIASQKCDNRIGVKHGSQFTTHLAGPFGMLLHPLSRTMCRRGLKNDTVLTSVKRPFSVFCFESEETDKNHAPRDVQWGVTGIDRDVGLMLPYTGLLFSATIPQGR